MGEKLLSCKEMPIGGVIVNPGNSLEYKTGDWKVLIPKINQDTCIRCRICWYVCPDNAIKELDREYITNKGRKYKISYDVDADFCKGCGMCAQECPVKAIEMVPVEVE
ncbi:MAG: 4Fe-4S binding protein [Caldisphaeraceae archaeon]|nr:4Fe-4S binding protein [Caldisphaeraceae archaeon]